MILQFKSYTKEILYHFLKFFGSEFSNKQFSPYLLLKHICIQKILRINSHVPWPVHWTTRITSVDNIEKGTRNPGLSPNCYIDGRNGVIIGSNVWVGPYVKIISMNHDTLDYHKYKSEEPIVIGNNCWLAAGCTILPGVQLGNHVIVAAGAVVTKSFLDNDILIGGVPAKVIKTLPSYNVSASHV